ncbi:glycoside hydrolase family 47 protein [Trichodelitschia bisporula]|uniref:alpha-1,2-Mannosidase n=1 Tax=Trichodelitschia bisporula TaxID=703511 RepID=A0A6G1I213_9PEZI|nr:glycoside hydrolase family 47 protein [Trichodelitschia bisporula]
MHTGIFLWILSLAVASPLPAGPPTASKITFQSNKFRQDAVKEIFTHAWKGYYQYAFPHDELHPVDNGFGDSRNGWGASAVDALSTAILMELPEVVTNITNYIPTINFSATKRPMDEISVFETTIRYLGGMLSGYDLLDGPFAHLVSNRSNIDALLTQSKTLADNLLIAFDTPTRIPDNTVFFTPNKTRSGDLTNGLATIGTLVLEWTRLSDLLRNPKYARLTQHAESFLLDPQPPSSEPFPGLVGTYVSLADGKFQDASGGWGGGDDSFYEYLIKMFVYDPLRFRKYRDRWIAAADSSITFLASHPSSRPDLTFLAAWDGKNLQYQSEHLACFNGGNFILAGLALRNEGYRDFGLQLVDGCRATYAATASHIGPEVFNWLPASCGTNITTKAPLPPKGPVKRDDPLLKAAATSPYRVAPAAPTVTGNVRVAHNEAAAAVSCVVPAAQADFYAKNGFWLENPTYDLRPEVLESYYYAYRATGDPKYQEWAWEAIVAINETTRVGSGFTMIKDVNKVGGGSFAYNNQESFFFAEVLKYAYLIFVEEGEWQVNPNGDGWVGDWVFNTEAHLVRTAW